MFVIGANSASTGYNLTRSLRTRASASGHLTRTFAALSTVKTQQTFSVWCKRGSLSAEFRCLFGAYDGSSTYSFALQFASDHTLQFEFGTSSIYGLYTTQVFRDPSAWYHIVLAIDTTQATASNRVKIYVNGTQVTSFSTANYPAQNAISQFPQSSASAWSNKIASTFSTGGSNFFDGYTTEINFIDGQALTPSSFGSTNALTGVWQPARYTGTYGTNGFYLPFTDNSALTTSSNVGLGKDFSGNGNYWTTNNISITAGVTYDSMTDVPTLTSATAANFAVANPVDQYFCSIAQGNLNVTTNNGGYGGGVRSTIAVSSGKWYWESVITVLGGTAGQAPVVGIIPPTTPINAISSNTRYAYYGANGNKLSSAGSVAYGAAFSTGDVIGHALDLDAGTLTFYKNNTSQGTAFTGLSGSFCAAVYDVSTGGTTAVNFGQRPFTYTPPTGFVALNTYNLPTSTIVKGNTVMDATLWAGDNTARSITNAAAFKPDLVWIKDRTTAGIWHVLFDSVRGVGNQLSSNQTDAELASASNVAGKVSAFNSNGFSVVTGSSSYYSVNQTAENYVGWQWQAGQGSSSSNTNGTITSTVSVNASAGFSVVTYTGTGANATVGHGLGVAPQLVILKDRVTANRWLVYHSSLGATQGIYLESTLAASTSSTFWNNTAPTSSTVSVGTWSYSGNQVMYCWTPIAGFSAFGSYTGNGSADGVFVYFGFKPRFVLIKRTDGADSWCIWDTARNTYNAVDELLLPNSSSAAITPYPIDVLSNGMKARGTNTAYNASGGTYIYAAFASNPFRNSLAQ